MQLSVALAMALFLVAGIFGTALVLYKADQKVDIASHIKLMPMIMAAMLTYSVVTMALLVIDGGSNIFIIFGICLAIIATPTQVTLGTYGVLTGGVRKNWRICRMSKNKHFKFNTGLYSSLLILSGCCLLLGLYTLHAAATLSTLTLIGVIGYLVVLPVLCFKRTLVFIHSLFFDQ